MTTKDRESRRPHTSQILGIYIPTYNRKEKLEVCLDSFIPQAARHGIPIFISDNASADGTKQLIKKIKRRYSNIHYNKHKTNIGYSSNFASLLKSGNTEFMWFFGDDDKIEDGAIDVILKHLKLGYDFLQINSFTYDNNLVKKIGEGPAMSIDHDVVYNANDYNIALTNAGYYAGFISSMITKRSFLIKELDKLDQKVVPNLIYLHTILYYRSIVNKKGLLITKPLFSVRSSDSGAYQEKPLELQVKSFPETIDYLNGCYEEGVLRKVKKPYSMLPVIFMSKRNSPELARKNIKYLLESNCISNTEKLFGVTILLLPDFFVDKIADPMKKFYHALFQ